MKWDLNVKGRLVIARSGKMPSTKRRRLIRKKLIHFAERNRIPDQILAEALKVISLDKSQLSEEQNAFNGILDRYFHQNIESIDLGQFIENWYKINYKKSCQLRRIWPRMHRKKEQRLRKQVNIITM